MHFQHLIVFIEGETMSNIIDQLNEVKKRFSDDIFLSNKGLSNEVGIHVFCYDPREEMLVSSFFSDLIQSENQNATYTEFSYRFVRKNES